MGGAGVDVRVLVADGRIVGTAVAVSVGVYAGVALAVACNPPAAMNVAIPAVASSGFSVSNAAGSEHEVLKTKRVRTIALGERYLRGTDIAQSTGCLAGSSS
jgi:hypothetical protein